jgi:hypothetical protein
MPTPIIDGNTWTWKCSCSLCDHRSSSMFISPHQCDYLSPFDINGKGYISLGFLPLTELSLRFLPLVALSYGMLFMHLVNLSSWNHTSITNQGKKNNSPCGYISPYLLCNMLSNHCEQYATTVFFFCCRCSFSIEH